MLVDDPKTDRAQATPAPPDGRKTSHRMLDVQIQPTRNPVVFLTHYHSWCRLLEGALAQDPQVIVWYLSSVAEDKILSAAPSYGRLCAMLTLTFPDVLFVSVSSLADIVKATQLWDVAFSPLFDGAGCRNNIRKQMQNGVAYLPLRSELAVAIDDEDAYALLHAYSAYRFGFRAIAIGTEGLANLVLSEQTGQELPLGYPSLTIEDLYISFPDQKKSKGTSVLANRHKLWPLTKTERRIFVTSDHDRRKWQDNQVYLSEARARGIDIRKLHKPHAGMFRIWESAGLTRGLRWSDGRARGGYAPGFEWPPEKPSAEESEQGHSSPGFLKVLAERMVERAERMIPAVQSVTDAVKGAVLATDALELLGARTPTLAIEALRLKHHFEVLAECQFSGVEYHIPLHGRLAEIRRDVRVISKWFGYKQREFAAMNAEMAILTTLVRVFRSFGQFDEEQQCMQRARHLHNTLWMDQKPARRLLWPVLRYLELLLSSFATFVQVLAVWVLILGILFWLSGHSDQALLCGLQDAVSSFFSMGPPVSPEPGCKANNHWPFALVTSLTVFASFVHLGVFVTHLYTIIMRR